MMLFSQGDSGGGATVLLEGRHVLIGITVGMNGNCTTNTPTKVRPIFIGFLEETCKIHYFPWPNTVRMFLPVLVLIRYFQSRRVFFISDPSRSFSSTSAVDPRKLCSPSRMSRIRTRGGNSKTCFIWDFFMES